MSIRSKCLSKGDTSLTWLMIGSVIWVNNVFYRGFRQNTFFAMIWSLVSLLLHSAVVHRLCEFDVVCMVCILPGLSLKPVLFKATWIHCLTRRHIFTSLFIGHDVNGDLDDSNKGTDIYLLPSSGCTH